MRFFIGAFFAFLLSTQISCNNNTTTNNNDDDAIQSVLLNTDSLKTFPFVEQRVDEIKKALLLPVPIMLCRDSLNDKQKQAQDIAIKDTAFTTSVKNKVTKQPYRCEIFGVYPARQSDMSYVKTAYDLHNCYRVDMYNYALNQTSSAIVDIQQAKTLARSEQTQTQPDIPEELKKIAIKIAVESPEVQKALGVKPSEKDILYTRIKTALNRSRCERSKHLCVSPTFVQNGKALWAIVDLTDYKLVGLRWTNVGETPAAQTIITERKLQDDKVTACFCERETDLEKDDWKMRYMITNSDGLRISQVSYKGRPVLQSAKLVDWHVSYSKTDAFGYSDAAGCPYFSQAAVVAIRSPKVAELYDDKNDLVGFSLEQTFRMDAFPAACNYEYFQRYDFYKDGRFRVVGANNGRGCGNDGTYRPVFRISFAAEQNSIADWDGKGWKNWTQEKWGLQGPTTLYTPQGYQYKLQDNMGFGYYIEPSKGQFKDGGRGDNAYLYATLDKKGIDEGESDMATIGPCCNTDYHQGPEKFMEPNPDPIENKKLVIWYVPQIKNDDSKGREYCWAESVLVNGVYKTNVYPCFCGPMFTPIK